MNFPYNENILKVVKIIFCNFSFFLTMMISEMIEGIEVSLNVKKKSEKNKGI